MTNPPAEKTKEEKSAAFKAWYEKNKARVALKNQARNEELKQNPWTCECGKTLSGTCGRELHYNTTIHKKNMVKKGLAANENSVINPTIPVVTVKARVLLTEEQKKQRAKDASKKNYEKVSAEKGVKKRVPLTEEQKKERVKKERVKKVRVLLTEEQKKQRAKNAMKKYYEKVSAEKGRKKRVLLTEEQKKERVKKVRVSLTEEQKKERVKKVRVSLTEEQKKERKKEIEKTYYENHKAERVASSANYRQKNKDKINAQRRLNYVKKERTTRSDKGSSHTYPQHVVRKRVSKYANETGEEKAERMREVNRQKYLRHKEKQ